MKLFSPTGHVIVISALLAARALSAAEATSRWEFAAGVGQSDIRRNSFRDRFVSRQIAFAYRPLHWLVGEFSYARHSAEHLKSDSLRLGPGLIWTPIERLEFSVKALASYQNLSLRIQTNPLGLADPPFFWEGASNLHFVPAAGARFAISRRFGLGVAYEKERFPNYLNRGTARVQTWAVQASVRW